MDEQRANSPALPSREDDHSPTEEGVPEPFGIDDGLPDISVEKPDDLVEVEVGDLGVPRVEDYLPDGVEREGFDPLPPHVDGYEPPSPANPEGESPDPAGVGYDEDVEVDASLLEPTFESLEALPLVVTEDFADRLHFKASVFSSVEDDGWTSLKMRGRVIYLQKPSFVRDHTTNASLSVDKANDGMKKEIRALDALRVGDAITKAEADAYCREHGVRVLSTRWVSVAKKDGETKEDIVRARVVARDYAAGGPTAAELGISSPISSNEAFRTFLVFVSATGSDVVLADVSTAVLFALIVSPECVIMPPSVRFEDNSRVYLKLRKALYGLRSASLAWYKHLSELVKEMGLHATDTEKSVFSGEYEFRGKKVWMLLLAYVDDLMIACRDREAALNLIERLGRSVKIRVTGILSRDKRIEFLGRVIEKIEYGLMLGLSEDYFKAVYEGYGVKKPSYAPPDLRKMLDDAIGKPELQAALSSEAASKYRSAIGKVRWVGQARLDLTYFISVLSRGQSTPLVVHENCLRSFLRYLMSVDRLKQAMCAEECCGRVEAYVDSNWAPERNNDRKSLSGCVILVDGFPVKGFTRQLSGLFPSCSMFTGVPGLAGILPRFFQIRKQQSTLGPCMVSFGGLFVWTFVFVGYSQPFKNG